MKYNKYPKYKNSGISWLGEIPEHWEIQRGKDIGKFDGSTIDKKTNEDEKLVRIVNFTDVFNNLSLEIHKIPFMEVSAKPNQIKSFNLLIGDVLFTPSSEDRFDIGRSNVVKYTDNNLLYSYHLIRLRFAKNIDINFKKYLFNNKYIFNYFSSVCTGTTRQILIRDKFKNIPVFLPPISEQTAIANFLDYKLEKIDRFITKKKQLIELLNEQKAAIINQAVTKGVGSLSGVEVKMKPSGIEWLGDIPESWEVRKLKEISENFGRIGFRGYKTSDLVNKGEGAITISPSNIKESFMTFEKCSYLSWKKYEQSPEIKIYNNDILMVKTGSTYGKVGFVKELREKATINPQLLVLKNISINPIYLYHLLKSNLVQIQVKRAVIGSTIPTISQTKISNFKIVLPSINEIDKILIFIETETTKIDKTIATTEKEIALVEEYKTALISEAVTGKIDVRKWSEPLIKND